MGGRKNSSPDRTEGGFTLLELLVALAIISFAVAAAYSLQHQGFRSFQRANLVTGAVLVAQEKLAEAQLLPPRAGRGVAQGPSGESLHWEVDVGEGPFEGVREVRVRVRAEPRAAPILEATSYVPSP